VTRDAQRSGRAYTGEATIRRALTYDWNQWNSDPRAIVIDNTDLSVDEVVGRVSDLYTKRFFNITSSS